jgi:anti-sigma factor RsiW
MSDKPEGHDARLEQVMAYYGGDLTGEERTEFEAHLAGCQECQNALAQAKQALPTAEALAAFQPKRTIDEQVARFEEMVSKKRAREADELRTRQRRLWISLAVATAVAAAVGYVFLRVIGSTVAPDRQVYIPPKPAADGGS